MKTELKTRRFAFHHQNEPLLFQFLLHECINAHAILRKQPSLDMIPFIIGNQDGEENLWQRQHGHVARLRHYHNLFISHFGDPLSPLFAQLDQIMERAYNVTLQCRVKREKDEGSLRSLYCSLSEELTSFFKLLFVKLPDYRDSPSILHFLLRHQEECDAAYQEPIIKKIFSSFFPQVTEEARLYLIDWFSKMGFEHLLPSIEENLKKMGYLEPLEANFDSV